MISARPLIEDGCLDLLSVDYLANAWVIWSDFLWLIGGHWRKVPFNDQWHHSFEAAILDLVSVDSLTNARVNWSDIFVVIGGQ
jgi:hypothetical protein